MEENQFSRTALVTAYIRAYHAIHDSPKIFDDFLAYHLIMNEIRANIEQQLARSLQLYDPARATSCPDQATALACPSPSAVRGIRKITLRRLSGMGCSSM